MKKFGFLIAFGVLILFGTSVVEKSWADSGENQNTEQKHTDNLVDFAKATEGLQKTRGYFEGRQKSNALTIAIADNDKTRAKGLMFVGTLQDNEVMYFKFSEIGGKAFWMKNTYVPLDMIFLDADNTIVHMEKMAAPHNLTPRGTDKPVAAVLEIKGGQGDALGLKLGDKLILETL